MEIKISLPPQALKQWNESLEQKLQVAAVKAWETAVERTPAAMEGPYANGLIKINYIIYNNKSVIHI